MGNIYNLNLKKYKSNLLDLVYEENRVLFCLHKNKKVDNGQVHWTLTKLYEYCTIKTGDSPITAITSYGRGFADESKNYRKGWQLTRIEIVPGNFYPRIYRPILKFGGTAVSSGLNIDHVKEEIYQYPDYLPYNEKLLVAALNQLSILKDMLKSVFNTIYPVAKNLGSFGHDIKNLLVLACIEVETQLLGIYKANERTAKSIYKTIDYVKLKEVLQLDKYTVRLPLYPDLEPISPFKLWKSSSPTRSLEWYDSYNAIKHNGENEFHRASLKQALSAICAVVVLIKAQYGNNVKYWQEEIGGFFEVINNTSWSVEEQLLPPFENSEWKENKIGL